MEEKMNTRLDTLMTEQVNSRTTDIDQKSTEELLALINNEDKSVPDAVARVIPAVAQAVDGIVARMKQGGRLFYVGAGTSGRLGVLDASECPPTYGTDPDLVQAIIAGGESAMFRAAEGAEDNEELGRSVIREKGVTKLDTVVGIAASGRTPFVIGAVKEAREIGALTVSLSNNAAAILKDITDISIIPEVGPEVIMGSTRMKAGTSQKLVLNMISTSVMIKLGKVYGNLMVDLKPNNEKLMIRAARIISLATGLSREKAHDYLLQADKNPKTAIVMAKTGYSKDQAKALLDQAEGYVSEALRLFQQK
jgi:N-acetylmuramic acid 6-phosphate etherase